MNAIEHEPVPSRVLKGKEPGGGASGGGCRGAKLPAKKNFDKFFFKVKKMGLGKILIIIQTTNTKYSNYFSYSISFSIFLAIIHYVTRKINNYLKVWKDKPIDN